MFFDGPGHAGPKMKRAVVGEARDKVVVVFLHFQDVSRVVRKRRCEGFKPSDGGFHVGGSHVAHEPRNTLHVETDLGGEVLFEFGAGVDVISQKYVRFLLGCVYIVCVCVYICVGVCVC